MLTYKDAKDLLNKKPAKVKAKLTKLIKAINQEVTAQEDYTISDPDCSEAEYAASFGYGDGKIDYSSLTREQAAYLKTLDKDTIKDMCTLMAVDHYTQDGEIYSVYLGEIEVHFSGMLREKLEKLTEGEFAIIKRLTSASTTEYGYGNCDYHRWVMVVDLEQLDNLICQHRITVGFDVFDGGARYYKKRPVSKSHLSLVK
jgi:hypothetical protein